MVIFVVQDYQFFQDSKYSLMQLQRHTSLKPYNTFHINETAEYFVCLNNTNELDEIAALPYSKLILGGGSNILLTKPVNALVIYNQLKGITILRENENFVWMEVASGEIWHDFVLYTVNNGWGGIENLSLIPGTVGASPVQNIGAYGVEVKDVIESVNYYSFSDKSFSALINSECKFGYRNSVFKNELKDKAFITSVIYKLNKKPILNTSYGAIEEELKREGGSQLSVNAIAKAVINIRSRKLPNPAELGNAGSFFKNPEISKTKYEQLATSNKGIPSYPVNDTTVKVPAAWLIEKCGWKGYTNGSIGVHKNQTLVLVNFNNGSGNDLLKLSDEIIVSVKDKFGIDLEREVQVW